MLLCSDILCRFSRNTWWPRSTGSINCWWQRRQRPTWIARKWRLNRLERRNWYYSKLIVFFCYFW